MRTILFEDAGWRRFLPLTALRSLLEVRCGILPLWEKAWRATGSGVDFLAVRPGMRPPAEKKYKKNTAPCPALDPAGSETSLWLNGRVLWTRELVAEAGALEAGQACVTAAGEVLAAVASIEAAPSSDTEPGVDPGADPGAGPGGESQADPATRLAAATVPARTVDWPRLGVWYDLLEASPTEISADLERLDLVDFSGRHDDGGPGPGSFGPGSPGPGVPGPGSPEPGVPDAGGASPPGAGRTGSDPWHLLGEGGLYRGRDITIDPGVVLDTRRGPIVLDDGVHIMAGAVLEGPCYLGRDSLVKVRAVLYSGCSIGERCKVGGELENTMLQGFANKQHDGYLGHAVLGAWVNLGAATNNSDLKNTYDEIATVVDGATVGSGRMFLGCCLGDHTKTAIGTTLITGMVAGVGCNLFGAGFHPAWVPDFIWGQPGNYKEYRLDRMVETARTVMGRRDTELTPEYEALLRGWFTASAPWRDDFLSRLQHSRTAARRRGES